MQAIQICLTLPWATDAESFHLFLGSESIRVGCAASDAQSASAASVRCLMGKILVGVGAFELEVSPEGAEIFVGSILTESSEAVARFSRPSRTRLGRVTLRLRREWRGTDLADLARPGVGPWDVLFPLATPNGHLQLQASPFGGLSRGAVGARVWPCSLLVAAYIRRLYAYKGLQVQLLELGSGSGLCGLVAAAHGATVVLSDGDPRVLPLLHRNVADYVRRHEGPRPHVLRLDFSSAADVEAAIEKYGRFDVVIASDVLYEHRLVSPFFRSAAELLRSQDPDTRCLTSPTILVAVELRPCGVDLAVAMQEEGQHHGYAVKDVTNEMQLWVLTLPDELQVPPLEERHRLYMVSSLARSKEAPELVQTAQPVPGKALRLQAHQPWEDQGTSEWYSRSLGYWSQQEATCAGVLGGHPETSQQDLAASEAFLKALQPRTFEVALECGAGIGRITEGLLLTKCKKVDLLEPSTQLLEEARGRLKSCRLLGSARHFLERSLQDVGELPDRYDLIWVQWVLLYLTDSDVITALGRLRDALRPDGLIVVKENCLLNNSPGRPGSL